MLVYSRLGTNYSCDMMTSLSVASSRTLLKSICDECLHGSRI